MVFIGVKWVITKSKSTEQQDMLECSQFHIKGSHMAKSKQEWAPQSISSQADSTLEAASGIC